MLLMQGGGIQNFVKHADVILKNFLVFGLELTVHCFVALSSLELILLSYSGVSKQVSIQEGHSASCTPNTSQG